MKLTKHFDSHEFDCRCGECDATGEQMNKQFIQTLEDMRSACGFPFIITSGLRCHTHNEYCGGSINSNHLKGVACDIACHNSDERWDIVSSALAHGLSVGVAEDFVHVDMRSSTPVLFLY